MTRHAYAGLLALAGLLPPAALAAAKPEQAPAPPQAPPLPAPAARTLSLRPDGLGFCSPACRCGCREGAPCVCGAPATRNPYATHCPVDGYAMYPKTAPGGALVLACPVCGHEEPLTGPAARPPAPYQFTPQPQPYALPGYYAGPFYGEGGCAGGSCGAPAGRGVFRRR